MWNSWWLSLSQSKHHTDRFHVWCGVAGMSSSNALSQFLHLSTSTWGTCKIKQPVRASVLVKTSACSWMGGGQKPFIELELGQTMKAKESFPGWSAEGHLAKLQNRRETCRAYEERVRYFLCEKKVKSTAPAKWGGMGNWTCQDAGKKSNLGPCTRWFFWEGD